MAKLSFTFKENVLYEQHQGGLTVVYWLVYFASYLRKCGSNPDKTLFYSSSDFSGNFRREVGKIAFGNFRREVGLIIFRNFTARGLAPIYTPRDNLEICTVFGTVWFLLLIDRKIPKSYFHSMKTLDKI
jgi:hypothetical protein